MDKLWKTVPLAYRMAMGTITGEMDGTETPPWYDPKTGVVFPRLVRSWTEVVNARFIVAKRGGIGGG
jgi:hypothetical protein